MKKACKGGLFDNRITIRKLVLGSSEILKKAKPTRFQKDGFGKKARKVEKPYKVTNPKNLKGFLKFEQNLFEAISEVV